MEDLIVPVFAAFDAGALAEKVINILGVVLGLGLVIFFHELGHFAVAKWCNVHVERFSIGIGPILWSRQKGETEYALSALPFGGYVKMLGQDDMDPNQMTSSEIAENPRSYSAKSVPQRMAIISAGVAMNILTGFLFYVICFRSGVYDTAPIVGGVRSGSPAWENGIRAGDRILEINGEPVRTFMDINEGVMLSSGDIQMKIRHADQTEESLSLTPTKSSPGRTIGIGYAIRCEMVNRIPDIKLISDSGMPLDKAEGEFQAGDRITGMRVSPAEASAQATAESAASTADAPAPAATPEEAKTFEINLLHEHRQLIARYADRTITYLVERKNPDDPSAPKSTVEITVPPQQVRSLGLWMAMGPVRSIRKGSVAEKAGLRVGDEIRQVDGQTPGTDLDPLTLPNYFAKKAGQTVTLNVTRPSKDGPQNEVLTLVPEDLPGWTDMPDHKTAPLTIPAIGAGFQVQTLVAKVLPGSEAEKLGVFIPGTTKITRLELIHPKPESGEPDALGDKKTPTEIELNSIEKTDLGTTDEINWGWAFAELQRVPNRRILVHYENGKETGAKTLETTEHADGWYLWFRGFNPSVWLDERELQKAESIPEALGMATTKTRRTSLSIYRSLRQMVRGDVAMESLSGPLGIARIGYLVAERGPIDLLMFLAYLSINLAILNFLPIPILDGGHMVFLVWEGVTRRKPSPKVINWAHACGLLFLVSLFVFVCYIDIFVSTLAR